MSINYLAILPEILMTILGVLVLVLDPFWKQESRRINLGWLTAGGLVAVFAVTLLSARPAESTLAWGGMVRYDVLAYAFKLFFLFAAAVTALFIMDTDGLSTRAEAYALLLAATIGMNLMAASADLVMLYLAIETTSIPMYVLAGFLRDDDKSTEAGFKYLLFGAMTSAVLLYGLSLVYGFGGTTSLDALSRQFASATPFSFGVLALLIVGLGFKLSLVPFHFWAPDTYQGAPAPVLSTLKHFRQEYEAHIYQKHCPAKVCKALIKYEIQEGPCTGCTVCARNCPVEAITGERRHTHVIDPNTCIRCGICAQVCNFNAIEVVSEPVAVSA